ncbi:MAG TPA: PilN domain-containing protein [Burkholderiales bacterium]|nr:PilN domain-containing protein [Burkholderiales bacterium]
MIRINLLPHREERRKAQRRQLGVLAVFTVVIGAAVWLAVHLAIAGVILKQNDRNEFLTQQISSLDREIAEIKKLKDDIKALLSRKQVIEALQSDRSRPVRLLEELVRQAPEGVYLKSLKQEGYKVNVTGYAQSSARVSMFMRNLQAIDLVENSAVSPQLVEIKAATVNSRRVSEFNLNFLLKKPEVDVKAPSTPAKKG